VFMQTKREMSQTEFMLLPSLEERIPGDYYLRRLNRVLDLSFVHETVRDRYCQDNGRPSVDPEVIVRLFLLQAITGCGSVRRLLQEVAMHLGYRWFIGYGATEPLPDHSTLSKALDRFGDEVFTAVFERSIAQCQQSGLIEGKVLHVDATTIRADIAKDRVNQAKSSDPDARFGRFPDGTIKPGYKQQTVADDRSGVVVGLSVMPANEGESRSALAVVDEAIGRLGCPPEVVCADSAYANGANASGCEERGIRLVSPPTKPVTSTRDEYFTVEDFEYDESRDKFVCPAGEVLRNVGQVAGRHQRWKYRGSQTACRRCVLKPQCTSGAQRCLNVSIHHGSLVRLRADSTTVSFRTLYRRRSPVIEGVFAEAKEWHGLRRAWRRGLRKMLIQCLLVASVLNFKRLVAALLAIFGVLRDTIRLIRSFLKTIKRIRLTDRRIVSSTATN
jgi:transposase